MGDARTAIDRLDFKTARQKVNLAQQLQPTRPEPVAVLKEIDGREEMQKGDDAKGRGDTDAAIVFYSNAKDKCPELKQAAMAKIEALRNKIVPSVAKDDQIDALVRAYKYTDALNNVTTRLNADPSNVQLKSMKDAIESLRTTLTFCSEMKAITESAKEKFIDARDYDDDERVKDRKKEFDKLRTHFNDYPGQQQNNFLARDFEAVKATARSARDDAGDTEAKLNSAATFFDRRADKADEGISLPVIGGTADRKKAKAYTHFAETMRKLAEKTHALLK
jgi:hypothetical protein